MLQFSPHSSGRGLRPGLQPNAAPRGLSNRTASSWLSIVLFYEEQKLSQCPLPFPGRNLQHRWCHSRPTRHSSRVSSANCELYLSFVKIKDWRKIRIYSFNVIIPAGWNAFYTCVYCNRKGKCHNGAAFWIFMTLRNASHLLWKILKEFPSLCRSDTMAAVQGVKMEKKRKILKEPMKWDINLKVSCCNARPKDPTSCETIRRMWQTDR